MLFRSMRTALRAKVKLLGVIENMSGYACGQCGRTGPLFPGNAGPALAEEFGVPLVAKIPFHSGANPPAGRETLTDALAAVIG